MIRTPLFAAALALGLAGVALAQHHDHDAAHAGHAMTIRASIPDGAVLTEAPSEVRLTFEPAMRLDTATLTTATGERVPVSFDDSAPAETVVIAFETLTPDDYTLAFSADAGDHDMPGRVRFTVR